MADVNELWHSRRQHDWWDALQRYWAFVKPPNLALERKLDELQLDDLRSLDAAAWFSFLRDEYFRWKYTAANRYATTTRQLQGYADQEALSELHGIKAQLLEIDPENISLALQLAKRIKGLGTAGASGLLALMYPASFATVDQFVVKALRSIKDLPEADALARMNENSLTITDGIKLIGMLRQKANELNDCFSTKVWTPRKIDMILWTYGRDDDVGKGARMKAHRDLSLENLGRARDPVSKAMTNHERIAAAVSSYSGKILETGQIKAIVCSAFPGFSEGSLLPNDHAAGNKSSCSCAGTDSRIFDRVQAGKYRVRG